MTRRVLIAAAIGLLSLNGAAAKEKSPFEGRWVLDGRPEPPVPENLTQKIDVNGPEVKIESTWREPKNGITPLCMVGIMVTQISLKPGESTTQVGPFPLTSKTTVEGNQMTTQWATEHQGKQIHGKWVRTVSPDGKSMTMLVKEDSTGKDVERTLKFRRR